MSEPSNFASLVESLGAIVWKADPETFQFLFVSAHAEAILGYPSASGLEEALAYYYSGSMTRGRTMLESLVNH